MLDWFIINVNRNSSVNDSSIEFINLLWTSITFDCIPSKIIVEELNVISTLLSVCISEIDISRVSDTSDCIVIIWVLTLWVSARLKDKCEGIIEIGLCKALSIFKLPEPCNVDGQ